MSADTMMYAEQLRHMALNRAADYEGINYISAGTMCSPSRTTYTLLCCADGALERWYYRDEESPEALLKHFTEWLKTSCKAKPEPEELPF